MTFLMLKELHSNIQMLRKYGDDIISMSKKLDDLARQRVDLKLPLENYVWTILSF
jgi:hypothetical protein